MCGVKEPNRRGLIVTKSSNSFLNFAFTFSFVFSFSILNVLYEFPSPHASVTNNKTKLNVEFEIYCNKTKCEFTFYEIAVYHIRQDLNTSRDNYYSNFNYVNIRYHELKLIIGWWLLMYSLFALNMNYTFIF